ncbi:MAG: DUF2505 family protein [Pseudomonadota bacterium]
MNFEIRHQFDAGVEELERVMFHEDLPRLLTERVALIIEMNQLEASRTGDRLERKVRYLPYPMIRKIGPTTVEPEWMEWVEQSRYDFRTHAGEFANIPARGRIAKLMINTGRVRLVPLGAHRTERIVTGELKIKVFMVGRIAERVIHSHATKLLDQEAAALAAIIAEKAL